MAAGPDTVNQCILILLPVSFGAAANPCEDSPLVLELVLGALGVGDDISSALRMASTVNKNSEQSSRRTQLHSANVINTSCASRTQQEMYLCLCLCATGLSGV